MLDARAIGPLYGPWMAKDRETINSTEGKALKRLWDSRKGDKMSLERFASEVLKVSNGSYMSQLFNGRVHINMRVAKLMAVYLKCDVREFSPRLADQEDRVKWPFETLNFETVDRLKQTDLIKLEAYIRTWIMENIPDEVPQAKPAKKR